MKHTIKDITLQTGAGKVSDATYENCTFTKCLSTTFFNCTFINCIFLDNRYVQYKNCNIDKDTQGTINNNSLHSWRNQKKNQ